MDEMSALISGLFDRLLARKREAPPPEAPEVPEDARTEERAAATERALLEWLDESGERCAQIAWVADRSMDGVGVRSPHPLPPGAPVLITIGEDAPLKAMVRHCISDEDDWRIGLKVIRHEKRRFDRTPIEGEALVVWQSPAHGRRESPGQTLDVGEGGLGLRARAASRCSRWSASFTTAGSASARSLMGTPKGSAMCLACNSPGRRGPTIRLIVGTD